MAPEFLHKEDYLSGAVCLARSCPYLTGHPFETCHPPGEMGRYLYLEARHAGQLPIYREPIWHGEVDHWCPHHAGGEGHSPQRRGPHCHQLSAMGFPNCGGTIDDTHIFIWAPDHQTSVYTNCKGYFSMVLQALVNHRSQFSDIVGCSAKAYDICMFHNSSLFQKMEAGTSFPEHTIRVGDLDMPLCIMGNVA